MNYSTKAVVATVDLGFTEIQGLMLPDGSYAVAIPQLAELLSLPNKHASRDFKALLGEDFAFLKTKSEINSQPVNTLSLEQAYNLTLALYNKNPQSLYIEFAIGLAAHLGKDIEGLKILHAHNKNKKPRTDTKRTERMIQIAYQTRLGGEIEVLTPLGRADLVTSNNELYEFKHFRRFKEALGQVLVYRKYINPRKSYILLFGCPKDYRFQSEWNQMKSVCEDHGITLLGIQ